MESGINRIIKSDSIDFEVSSQHSNSSNSSTSGCNIYIKGLDESCTTEKLREMCECYGPIQHAKAVSVYRVPEKCRGFGFVLFTKPDCASKAIEDLNKKGYQVTYAKDHPFMKRFDAPASDPNNLNLYIQNFPADYSEQKVIELVSKFGNVKSVKLLNRYIGDSKGIVLAMMNTRAEAEAVIHGLCGVKLSKDSPPLSVRFAETLKQKKQKYAYKEMQMQSNMYQQGIPPIDFGVPQYFQMGPMGEQQPVFFVPVEGTPMMENQYMNQQFYANPGSPRQYIMQQPGSPRQFVGMQQSGSPRQFVGMQQPGSPRHFVGMQQPGSPRQFVGMQQPGSPRQFVGMQPMYPGMIPIVPQGMEYMPIGIQQMQIPTNSSQENNNNNQ